MKNLFLNDTIAAISTPVGKNGIGIVRLSGRDALSIADKVFLPAGASRPSRFAGHTINYGWIVEDSPDRRRAMTGKNAAEFVDEVLLTVMRSPRTYTREDVVEINCHSGIVVLRRILEIVLKAGARPAQPGEFTKRAYLNGRIDLTQAEAVADIINAQTQEALDTALAQLQGRLSGRIKRIRAKVFNILTQLELSINFSDQDVPSQPLDKLPADIKKIIRDIEHLLSTAERGIILREGISCVICGRPNAGKSSLLNALLKRERAIVTPVPGTTRDCLEETLDLEGVPLRLTDTAGIVRAENRVDREAVKRSIDAIKRAGIVLFIIDAACGLTPEDRRIFRYAAPRNTLLVLNKQDLPVKIDMQEAVKKLPCRKAVGISALRQKGLEELKKEMANLIFAGKIREDEGIIISSVRHREALKKARGFLKEAEKVIKKGYSAEIAAMEVRQAEEALGGITGHTDPGAVLERIFARFCIGK